MPARIQGLPTCRSRLPGSFAYELPLGIPRDTELATIVALVVFAACKNYGVEFPPVVPGGQSVSHRQPHSKQDEFGLHRRRRVSACDGCRRKRSVLERASAFPASTVMGHHFLNLTDRDAFFLGDRTADDEVTYPDIDLRVMGPDGRRGFLHRDGRPYPPAPRN